MPQKFQSSKLYNLKILYKAFLTNSKHMTGFTNYFPCHRRTIRILIVNCRVEQIREGIMLDVIIASERSLNLRDL